MGDLHEIPWMSDSGECGDGEDLGLGSKYSDSWITDGSTAWMIFLLCRNSKVGRKRCDSKAKSPGLEITPMPHSEIRLWDWQKTQPLSIFSLLYWFSLLRVQIWLHLAAYLDCLSRRLSLTLYTVIRVNNSFDFLSTNILSYSHHCQLCWELNCLVLYSPSPGFINFITINFCSQIILFFRGGLPCKL